MNHKSGAAYSRIMCYARSLASTGKVKVYLCSFKLSGNLDLTEEVEPGIFVVGEPKNVVSGKVIRNLFKILYPLFTISYFLNFNRGYHNHKFTWFFFPIKLFNDIIALIFVKLIRREEIFCEKNELKSGMVINQSRNIHSFSGIFSILVFPLLFIESFLNDRILVFYNGVVAISTRIETFAKKFNRKVIRIPILTEITDIKRNRISFTSGGPLLICFAGSISVKKEGLIDLLNALAILKRKGVHFLLNLYGNGNKASLKEIEKFALLNDLHDNIKLHGSIPHNKIPEILHEHHLLVMTRRTNLQSEYGFSTKMAEYLASGTATMVTDVSDNKLFIKDGVNGFLVSPGNVFGLSGKLFEIYQRNDLVEIGMKGRQTAENHFDYHHYKDILFHFFFK